MYTVYSTSLRIFFNVLQQLLTTEDRPDEIDNRGFAQNYPALKLSTSHPHPTISYQMAS